MSELILPKINKETISKKEYIFKNLAKIINPENVLSHIDEIKPYETDALAAYKQTPLVVVPYFKEWTPPEFSATLPPIEQASWLDGSGA